MFFLRVCIPLAFQARRMRTAISPRFAMKISLNMAAWGNGRAAHSSTLGVACLLEAKRARKLLVTKEA